MCCKQPTAGAGGVVSFLGSLALAALAVKVVTLINASAWVPAVAVPLAVGTVVVPAVALRRERRRDAQRLAEARVAAALEAKTATVLEVAQQPVTPALEAPAPALEAELVDEGVVLAFPAPRRPVPPAA